MNNEEAKKEIIKEIEAKNKKFDNNKEKIARYFKFVIELVKNEWPASWFVNQDYIKKMMEEENGTEITLTEENVGKIKKVIKKAETEGRPVIPLTKKMYNYLVQNGYNQFSLGGDTEKRLDSIEDNEIIGYLTSGENEEELKDFLEKLQKGEPLNKKYDLYVIDAEYAKEKGMVLKEDNEVKQNSGMEIN